LFQSFSDSPRYKRLLSYSWSSKPSAPSPHEACFQLLNDHRQRPLVVVYAGVCVCVTQIERPQKGNWAFKHEAFHFHRHLSGIDLETFVLLDTCLRDGRVHGCAPTTHSVCCFYSCSSAFSWLFKTFLQTILLEQGEFFTIAAVNLKKKKRKGERKEKKRRKKEKGFNFYIAACSRHTFQCSNWRNQSHDVKVKALKAYIPSNTISMQIYRWRVKCNEVMKIWIDSFLYVITAKCLLLVWRAPFSPRVVVARRILRTSSYKENYTLAFEGFSKNPRGCHATATPRAKITETQIGTALAPRWAWKSRSGVVASSRADDSFSWQRFAQPVMHRLCQFKAR
jgi:hypothetical protein